MDPGTEQLVMTVERPARRTPDDAVHAARAAGRRSRADVAGDRRAAADAEPPGAAGPGSTSWSRSTSGRASYRGADGRLDLWRGRGLVELHGVGRRPVARVPSHPGARRVQRVHRLRPSRGPRGPAGDNTRSDEHGLPPNPRTRSPRSSTTLSDVEFVGGESLSVDFLTRPEIVRSILPAELEPGDEPRITAQVSRWRSNCVGDFDASAIYVSARHGDVAGDYVLTMFMDTDVPMLFGRDLYGEPKKLGTSKIYRNDGHMSGHLERGGTRLIEIEADLDEDSGPTLGARTQLQREVRRSLPTAAPRRHPDARRWRSSTRRSRCAARAPATLRLGSTVHDPLGDLEILEVLGGVYVETGMKASCASVAQLDATTFLPLALGRSDYWPALVTARLP